VLGLIRVEKRKGTKMKVEAGKEMKREEAMGNDALWKTFMTLISFVNIAPLCPLGFLRLMQKNGINHD